jgi:hypothetical protein
MFEPNALYLAWPGAISLSLISIFFFRQPGVSVVELLQERKMVRALPKLTRSGRILVAIAFVLMLTWFVGNAIIFLQSMVKDSGRN